MSYHTILFKMNKNSYNIDYDNGLVKYICDEIIK